MQCAGHAGLRTKLVTRGTHWAIALPQLPIRCLLVLACVYLSLHKPQASTINQLIDSCNRVCGTVDATLGTRPTHTTHICDAIPLIIPSVLSTQHPLTCLPQFRNVAKTAAEVDSKSSSSRRFWLHLTPHCGVLQ